MGYVVVGDINRVDIARAEAIIRVAKIDNPTLNSEAIALVAEFLTTWSDDIPGRIDFDREVIRVFRAFRILASTHQHDASDLADALCLAIRQELARVEDTAINRKLTGGAVPTLPLEIAAWFAALEKAHTDAVVQLLWSELPPVAQGETNISSRSRTLYFRHKIKATASLYHCILEVYETLVPKGIARRSQLPTHYSKAPISLPSSITSADEIEQVSKRTGNAGTPIKGERSARSIDALFTYQFRTNNCDDLARMLDLCPPEDKFEEVSSAHAKIWAVITVLDESDYLAVSKSELAISLGKRYGYNMSAKLTKQGQNKGFQAACKHLTSAIRRWKADGRIR